MARTPNPKQPKPTAAHRRLEVFIGDWHAEGTSYGDGQDAADPRASDFDLELIESRTLDGNIQEFIYRPTLHL